MENTQKIYLPIEGMHCASCAATITKTLQRTKGIKQVDVNFATNTAAIEFIAAEIDIQKITAIIEKLGYKVAAQVTSRQTIQKTQQLPPNLELQKLRTKFVFSAIFGLPFVWLMIEHFFHVHNLLLPEKFNVLAQGIFTTIIMLINSNIYTQGLHRLWQRNPDMNSLLAIGTLAAYFYSLLAVINFWYPLFGLHNVHVYFESAAFILIFIALGRYLEGLTKAKTSGIIKKMLMLQPTNATLLHEGREISVAVMALQIGDIVLVKPGEQIPVDGVVVNGLAAVDEQMLTGESIPVGKQVGSNVYAATFNKSGVLQIKVTKLVGATLFAKIVNVVQEAINSKAPIQLLADKVSYYFVPTVIVIAILSLVVWLMLGKPLGFALTTFIAVLVIACPCALGLATPTAIIMGTGVAAEKGILLKNNRALELAHKITTVVFDKTGTLTQGKMQVTDVEVVALAQDKYTVEQVVMLAAALERNSEHPLAQAVLEYAQKYTQQLISLQDFTAVIGKGVKALWQQQVVLLGTANFLTEFGVNIDHVRTKIMQMEAQGKSVMLLAIASELFGIIAVTDVIREQAAMVVKKLQQLGKKVIMLTGDNQHVAQAVAQQLNIAEVIAGVLPDAKAGIIKDLQQQQNIVAMIGDGINDAPALVQADIGIALSSATDIAVNAGDIVLLTNDLNNIITAIKLADYTFRKIKQNLFWAFCYNVVGIVFAAGIFYPLTGWLLNPVFAALAMAFSSVSVVGNSLSMRWWKE